MRHRTRSFFATTLVATLTLLALAPFAQAGEFHVSPAGDDTGDGSAQKPFATLEKARDAARQEKNSKVVLAPGAHRRTKTLELNERDSGTVFTGKGAVIVGSVAVPTSSVKPVTDAAILERLLPEVRGKVMEIDLSAQGLRRPRPARFPPAVHPRADRTHRGWQTARHRELARCRQTG
jgi:hypothetical protein